MAIPELNNISDSTLLEHFYKERNNKWLGILLERYTVLLYGVCIKYLKEEEESRDAVQQIYLKVISELEKHQVTYFKSWLYQVAKNYCLMQLRGKGKTVVPVSENLYVTDESSNDMISDLRSKEETYLALNEALEELNTEQKQCIKLFYLQKKSYQEIAGETGYTSLQVKSFIQNGKRNLKIKLEKKNQYKNA